jgi:hypothetical protein
MRFLKPTCLALTVAVFVVAAGLTMVASAVDVTGSWTVTIKTGNDPIKGLANLKQIGDRVTGQIGPSQDPTIPIEGALKGTKLTLKTNPRAGRTAAFDSCELTVSDQQMTGTITGGDVGKGTIEFVRVKK